MRGSGPHQEQASLGRMRTVALALLLVAAAFVAGCGQDDDASPVALRIAGPADGAAVHEAAVEGRGRVRRAAGTVFCLGKRATVSGGEFRARVPLNEGSNVIDVGASAGGAKS